MKLLSRALRVQAALWFACGVAVLAVPGWVVETFGGQPPYPDHAYTRVAGALSISMSLLAVLISRRVEELWWWAWAFIVADVLVVTVTALNALTGEDPAWFWWLFAAPNALLAAGLLAGMGRAGQEKPIS